VSARNVELETAAFTDLHDVGTWRVYADWLQSVGDPRGELVSLELLRRDGFRSEREALAIEIETRAQPCRDAWQTWAGERELTDVEPTFRRGFVHALAGSLEQLEPVLDELFERHPIQRLELRDVDADTLVRVCEARPPWSDRLVFLRLFGSVGADGGEALAKLSLHRLDRLNLLGTELDDDACKHLARLDAPKLRALTLTSNEIEADGLAALLESPTRTSWRELYLGSTPLRADGIARLGAASGLEQLEQLYVCETTTAFGEYEPLLSLPRPADHAVARVPGSPRPLRAGRAPQA
jgi:uncharacterized protein (TIGR02996 family)